MNERTSCKRGCLLSDHDDKGHCHRDCGRCPERCEDAKEVSRG